MNHNLFKVIVGSLIILGTTITAVSAIHISVKSSEARFVSAVESDLQQCTVAGHRGKFWVKNCL